MASKVGVYNLRFAQRETFSHLENGKGQLGKSVLSCLDTCFTCSTWEVTWGQTHSRIQQDVGEFFYPLLALFELNPQILDTRDVNKGQTGLKYKVTAAPCFVCSYSGAQERPVQLCQRLWLWARCNLCTIWLNHKHIFQIQVQLLLTSRFILKVKCQLSRGHLRSGRRSSSFSLFPPIRIKPVKWLSSRLLIPHFSHFGNLIESVAKYTSGGKGGAEGMWVGRWHITSE